MTPATRLRAALCTLHWTATALAKEAEVSVRLVQYWLKGRYEPPEPVLVWLEGLAWYHENHPLIHGENVYE